MPTVYRTTWNMAEENIKQISIDKAEAKYFGKIVISGIGDIGYYIHAIKRYHSALASIWREARLYIKDKGKTTEIDKALAELSRRVNTECLIMSRNTRRTKRLSMKTMELFEELHRAVLAALQVTGLGMPVQKIQSETTKRRKVLSGEQ